MLPTDDREYEMKHCTKCDNKNIFPVRSIRTVAMVHTDDREYEMKNCTRSQTRTCNPYRSKTRTCNPKLQLMAKLHKKRIVFELTRNSLT